MSFHQIKWQINVISVKEIGCNSKIIVDFSLSVVFGTEDQEKAEDGASLSGQVQTKCWPVLSHMHTKQSGKCAVKRLCTIGERLWLQLKLISVRD